MWLLLPKTWLRYILKKSNCFKLYLDYLKSLNKVTSCNYRIEFLKQCLNNDIIPDFLRFRAPKNEIFSEQAVHSFQLKLLKQEINRAEKGRKVFREKLVTDRSSFREKVRPELMPSVVSCIKREMRGHSAMVQNRLNGKLDKLSERQDRPLRNDSHSNVVIMDGPELPKFVLDILSLGPKHPVRDKFNEVHFRADVDKLVRELRENNTEGEKLCEIEASAKRYAKNVRETPLDRGVKKVHDYLKANDLLAVPFDKGCGFCVMKKSTYREKLDEVMNSDQFQKIEVAKDEIVIKNEKQINNSLQNLMKQGKISDKI